MKNNDLQVKMCCLSQFSTEINYFFPHGFSAPMVGGAVALKMSDLALSRGTSSKKVLELL